MDVIRKKTSKSGKHLSFFHYQGAAGGKLKGKARGGKSWIPPQLRWVVLK